MKASWVSLEQVWSALTEPVTAPFCSPWETSLFAENNKLITFYSDKFFGSDVF